MKFVIFYVVCFFLSSSVAFHSRELCVFHFRKNPTKNLIQLIAVDEAEHCCEMGRFSRGPLCNLDFYSARNTTSELCRSSFNLCCQKQKGERDCMAGIAAAMSNRNCWALTNPIDYQVNIFIHIFLPYSNFLLTPVKTNFQF